MKEKVLCPLFSSTHSKHIKIIWPQGVLLGIIFMMLHLHVLGHTTEKIVREKLSTPGGILTHVLVSCCSSGMRLTAVLATTAAHFVQSFISSTFDV